MHFKIKPYYPCKIADILKLLYNYQLMSYSSLSVVQFLSFNIKPFFKQQILVTLATVNRIASLQLFFKQSVKAIIRILHLYLKIFIMYS